MKKIIDWLRKHKGLPYDTHTSTYTENGIGWLIPLLIILCVLFFIIITTLEINILNLPILSILIIYLSILILSYIYLKFTGG